MSGLLLGIDVGTYSSKGVLVDPTGAVVGQATVAHGIDMPAPGHVEQDADGVWWHDVVALCQRLLNGDTYRGADVAGVAMSAIGPCLLPVDAGGRPLRPGILYGVDTRATVEIVDLEARYGAQAIYDHSRMALSSQAIGPKVAWLRRHEPDVWARTAALETASSYLTYRLTGERVMDRHTAGHYMPMFDPATLAWSTEFEDDFGEVGLLPHLAWSGETAGHVHAAAATETGLPAGTPVAVGAADALSEAISVGAAKPGDLMVMYGSTTFFIAVQDAPTPHPSMWTVPGARSGQWNLAAGMATTGSLTRWFRDQLAPDLGEDGYDVLFEGARAVPAGADGLVVLPYFSGERTPILDPDARGAVLGLTLAHTRAHLFRAVLEGVAFGVRHNLETFRAAGADVARVFAVGGGASTDVWLQIVADVAGVSQRVSKVNVGASYGDAFLAGLATGAHGWGDLDAWVRLDRTIEPDTSVASVYDERYEVYRELYTATKGLAKRLGARDGSVAS